MDAMPHSTNKNSQRGHQEPSKNPVAAGVVLIVTGALVVATVVGLGLGLGSVK